MNSNKLSFQELKSRVSVIDVASFLGYKFDRSKGMSQPSFVLTDAGGDVTDRIYIKNPRDNSTQGYWRRNGIQSSGDVISFVKENITKFGVSGRNELDTINNILHKFAGRELEAKDTTEYKKHSHTEHVFDPERWTKVSNNYMRDRILSSRSISMHTAITFSQHIDIVQDKEQQGKYNYIGFPYTIPGENKHVGYELRGLNGFKSKATGTNSTEGMWLATFTDNPSSIKNIYITESAFDALSFYQLHKERINLSTSAFVSFGGSFSDKQFNKLREQFPTARPVLLFDKDLNGHMYDIRAIALMSKVNVQAHLSKEHVDFEVNGNKFSIPQKDLSATLFSKESGLSLPPSTLLVYKPQAAVKDWNDLLKQEVQHPPTKYEIKR